MLEEEEESDAKEEAPEEEIPATIPSPTIALSYFQGAGHIYSHEGKEKWIVFVGRTLNAAVTIDSPTENGFIVHWKAHGPTDNELLGLTEDSGSEVREYKFTPSEVELFIPSPRQLLLDSQFHKQLLIPPEHPRWLVAIIPFAKDEPTQIAALNPFIFPADYKEKV